jgi:choline-sulfatase
MLPQLRGAAGDPDRAVFAEGGYDRNESHCYEGADGWDPDHIYYPKGVLQPERPESSVRATMIRAKNYKLIYRPLGLSELYDVTADPGETANLYDDQAFGSVRADLERQMLDWYVHTSDVVPHAKHRRGYSEEIVDRFAANSGNLEQT